MLFISLFIMIHLPPTSTLFPYTTLFRSKFRSLCTSTTTRSKENNNNCIIQGRRARGGAEFAENKSVLDRKSTRLNSSHLVISYAVFCLKKKITTEEQ